MKDTNEGAMAPVLEDIERHLHQITRRWGELDEPTLLEVVFLTPTKPAETRGIKTFPPTPEGIEEAAAYVAGMNIHKLNAYATVNPIDAANRPATGKRAKGTGGSEPTNILASFYHWADADTQAAADNVRAFTDVRCTMHVLTGAVPHQRVHPYFELEEPTRNWKAWQATQKAIEARFGSDSVFQWNRMMRIAGTISWPPPHKVERGYVPEIAKLRIYDPSDRPPISSERMAIAFAVQAVPNDGPHIDTGDEFTRKTAEDYEEVLRRARTDGEKHFGVKDLANSLAGQGVKREMAEAIIRQACPVWDANVVSLIDWAYEHLYRPGGAGETGHNASAGDDAPIPLYPPLPPAQPFPVEALGPVLAPAAAAITRKVQVPAAVAAQSVLTVGALAAQAHADVVLPYGQRRPLSCSAASILGSGDRKTTADAEAAWPVKEFERELRATYDIEHEEWAYTHSAWAAEKRKIEANTKYNLASRKAALKDLGPEPPKPLAPWVVVTDVTLEGLLKTWVAAPASLGLFTAEGATVTNGHGMAEENKRRTAGTLSLLWDGSPVKRIRAMDGATVLPGRRLSMHLMIQPDVAAEFLSDPALRDQGLLSRILLAAPASVAGSRAYEVPRPEDEAAIKTYGGRILRVLRTRWPLAEGTRNELEPRRLPISAEAEALWIRFFNHVEGQSGKGGPLEKVRDFASKAAEHAARIAGVMTILEDTAAAAIGVGAMRDAVTLMNWYIGEAVRLQQAARTDPELRAAHDLLDWMRRRAKDADDGRVGFRDVTRHGPAATRLKKAAEVAVKALLGHGWIRQVSARPLTFTVVVAEDEG